MGTEDVIPHIARQTQSARFFIGRLWKSFAHETASREVMHGLVTEWDQR